MSFIKRNIFANLLGGGMLTALTIIITPIQINLLGMEAYGVVGFIATLQVAFTAFDLGLSSTVTRELARDFSLNKRNSNDLLQTATAVYWLFAIILGLGIAIFSGDIARRWFNAGTMDPLLLQQSIQIIAIYLGLRWPVSLYIGILSGMQRMDWLNTVKVGVASFRIIGGVAVLFIWRSLPPFLIWTALSAFLEVGAYSYACKQVHPTMPIFPKIILSALKRIWRFSASMNALAILTILMVQFDRLVISKLLTLEDLGVYSLAYTAANVVVAIISAFGSATLPWFAAAHSQGDASNLQHRYIAATRALLYITGIVVSSFIFFGRPLLSAWVNPSVAIAASTPLALLALGSWAAAGAACAYQITIATGFTRIALRMSFISAPFYFIVLYVLVIKFGINGAAMAWLLLNIFYVVFFIPIVHRQILDLDLGESLIKIILSFALLSLLTFGTAYCVLMVINTPSHITEFILYGASSLLYVAGGYFLLGDNLQRMAKSFFRSKLRLS
jgi:O-antigen/teichoic acid export membrane protein